MSCVCGVLCVCVCVSCEDVFVVRSPLFLQGRMGFASVRCTIRRKNMNGDNTVEDIRLAFS